MTDQEIQYAKDTYPIGTKYKCATGDGLTHTIVGDRTTYKNVGHQVWGDEGKGCLFDKGTWAEIIHDPKLEKVINNYSIY